MIKTTVIIPNVNGKQYLENCLRSLMDSENSAESGKGLPFRVVVVDNGSSDGSQDMVRHLFPEVKLICFDTNTGFCKAVNAGILAADTPFVLPLNNDTTVCKYFVRNMTKAIEQNDGIFSISPKMLDMHHPDRIDDAGDYYSALGWAFARGKGKPEKDYDKRCSIFASCGGASIYNKKVMEEIGYFDENHFAYLEDMDIGYRAKIYGYRNLYEPTAVVHHAGSGFSGSRYNEFKIKLSSRNSIYLIGKNMPFLQIFLNLPFLCAGFLVKFLFFMKKGYGRQYARGLYDGFKLCLSPEGKKNKVPFSWKNTGCYATIQVELWLNVARLLFPFL